MADSGLSRLLFRLALTVAACLAAFALMPQPAQAARQVLVLNSYHPGYRWSDDIMRGLEVSLRQEDPEVLIQTEFMDTKRNESPDYLRSLSACLHEKYANLTPDVIVASDESAFHFMLEHGDKVFHGTPTVFCGVNANPLPQLPPWMTGVQEYADLTSTLRLMRQLQPGLREILVITDRTNTGLAVEAEIRKAAEPDLPVRVVDDLPLAELVRQAGRLEPDQGLFFALYFRDRDGRHYAQDEAIEAISRASTVPTFGSWNFLMGHGLFGGYLTSGYEQGRIAGAMTNRILAGEHPAQIPVASHQGVQLAVDTRQMERFGIAPDRLPEETRFFNAKKDNRHEILVLNSYNTGFKWTDDVMAGFRESLGDMLDGTELHVEFMDTKRHPEPEFTYLNYQLLREKFRFTTFSAVVTSDDNAFNFARDYRRSIFRDAPIVFCGVNYLDNPGALAAKNITGVVEAYDIPSTVQAAARLVPGARRLYVINDATPTGIGNRKRFEESRHLLPAHLEVEMLENLSMTRLLERVRSIPKDAIVLLMSFNRDRDGYTFTYDQSCERIANACPVPVFSFWDFYLGSGSVGGMVTSGRHQGMAAGELTRKVLSGKRAGELPVITKSPNVFIFDARAMDRFNLDRSLLPPDAILVNDDSESISAFAVWTISALSAFIALLLLGFAFMHRRHRRKRHALEQSVRIDPLTGALTRAAFEREMPRIIRQATERNEGFVLSYVDVDKLKKVNDTYGHMHGDTYLKEVVSVLRSCMRASDEIFRVGGDEFVVIFPSCLQAEVARVWDLVQARIDEINAGQRHPFVMGITHGNTRFDPQAPQDLAALLRQADSSMYTGKTATKDA